MKYPELSTGEIEAKKRFLVLLVEAPIFLGIIPAGVVFGGRMLDRLLGLPDIKTGAWNVIICLLLVIPGLVFGLWSVGIQFMQGRGTPAPQMASQELITGGPYAYSRNPMTFGTFLILAGVAVGSGTIMGLIIVATLTTLLLTFIKRGEEDALAVRFGDAYRDYRERTPFFFPRPRKRQ